MKNMFFFKRRTNIREGKTIKKYCPVCSSEKIKQINPFGGWLSQIQYVCENCGYSGTLIMEVEVSQDNKNFLNDKES
jgi:C4-type Zn-finger protein